MRLNRIGSRRVGFQLGIRHRAHKDIDNRPLRIVKRGDDAQIGHSLPMIIAQFARDVDLPTFDSVSCPAPGELAYPARRWVVERTFAWLNKRRAIRIRWTKKACSWLALLQFACAHILFEMAIFG